MDIKKETNSGLVISDDVIAKIAAIAATEVDGVVDVVPQHLDIKKMFKTDAPAKAVYVDDNQSMVDIYIKLKAGVKIADVAEEVQQNVKDSIQNMTGKVIFKVNVHICDVELEKQEEK
ncbi:MAG: Asp23/Gls24 family envelope stress response protein [Clostridia bacterium]|nr:Asp23/Gls24 family envelope stress response protein [Clostridia bacterium]